MTRTLVLGIDSVTIDSLKQNPILLWTLQEICKPNDTLYLVHGSKTLYTTSGTAANVGEATIASMQSSLEQAARVIAGHAGVDVAFNVVIKAEDPRELLVALANQVNATIVVCGSRGQGGLKKMILGSVSDHVAKNCDASVLICKK